ncbi:MAG: HAMP domain-containing histidine kinase [Selenomonadaceae bacterium]|nr:HAMP domain-containing histidine kinase [Selenomonadaceae bacterium]
MILNAKENITRQKKFIADVSHELRTPITVIKNYVEILENFGADDPALFKESMSAIKTAAENMQNLVESLLFLARADENTHTLQKVSVEINEILKSVVKNFKNPRVEFVTGEKFNFTGDPEFLKKMFGEILKNSLLYSKEKVIVEILTENNSAVVKFIDRGIGISENEIDRIFDRFYRADKSRTKIDDQKNSPGLGLPIAKWIADQHDIKINVQSRLGEGTTFEFEISK